MTSPATCARARIGGGLAAAVAALVWLASTGGGCGSTLPCSEGTLFLTLTFEGDALSAEQVALKVMTEDETTWRTGPPFAHPSGSRTGTIEIRFPGGYPVGKNVTVVATAQTGSTDIASNTGSVRLGAGCGSIAIPLGGASSGTGGDNQTGGGGRGSGGGGISTGAGGRGTGGATGTGGRATGTGGATGSGGRGTGGASGVGGAVLCTGTPFPGAPLITDFSEAAADGITLPGKGTIYAYGGVAGVVSVGGTTVGNRLLHVTGSVPADGYAGVGIAFNSCTDATGYLGFTLRLTGSLGACNSFQAGVVIPQNLSRATSGSSFAVCTASACYGPNGPITIATTFASFASMTGGQPVVTVGPDGLSRLTGVALSFHAPPGGCAVDFTIDDISLSRARPGAALETFDTGSNGFALNLYDDGTSTNLALPRDSGAGLATLAWDGTQGDPASGSLRMTAPFSEYGQFADAHRLIDPNAALDWTGKRTLWVRVRLDGGVGFNPPDQLGGAQVHVTSLIRGVGGQPDQFNYFSNYDTVWAAGGAWVDYPLDLAGLAGTSGWDPARIVTFGVQLSAGAGRPGAVKPAPASFHIDSFWLE